ncbi:MAG: TonB family protein, partial [Nannocystaceae bacterium]
MNASPARHRLSLDGRVCRWLAPLLWAVTVSSPYRVFARGHTPLLISAPSQIPEGLIPPALSEGLQVAYPPALLSLETPPEGEIRVRVVVGVDGVPVDVRVTAPLHPQLDALAMEAVRGAVFTPGTYRGAPVEVAIELQIPVDAPELPPPAEPLAAPEPPDVAAEVTEDPRAPEPETTDVPARPPTSQLQGEVFESGSRRP